MSVITFAHRGGMAHAPENTLAAFRKGVALGAGGLESDVWLCADGQPVLIHDEVSWRGFHRVDVARLTPAQLERFHVPRLADLFEAVGSDFELSLDLKDPASAAPTVEVIRRYGVPERSWLCVGSMKLLRQLREVSRVVVPVGIGRPVVIAARRVLASAHHRWAGAHAVDCRPDLRVGLDELSPCRPAG